MKDKKYEVYFQAKGYVYVSEFEVDEEDEMGEVAVEKAETLSEIENITLELVDSVQEVKA